MIYTLRNSEITLQVDTHGAEMVSLVKNDREYLWDADPGYWNRTAPVLFPIVGSLKDGRYRYRNTEYSMKQHGFARDMDFRFAGGTASFLSFTLQDDERTRKIYPFHFQLKIVYTIHASRVEVHWIVQNTDTGRLLFSIGGHPAFFCPPGGEGARKDCAITLLRDGSPLTSAEIRYIEPGSGGLVSPKTEHMELDGGRLVPSDELFARDALIIEHHQADTVALSGADGKEYLKVCFDAPLFGLWSPAGKKAPFVCIEPWYGRADGTEFHGSLEDRAYGNALEPGESFDRGFAIEL
ncbi:MAG: aldose 1-epimerase family protein [Lachnospiraceae bacterium]|jgi:galactose mutarotase-like enzyme|nr:aldose 1-epimerase family protein [Lachnospiraceae bacterium]